MSAIEITVPDIGGSTDVEVIELLVKAGDQVAVDDPVIVLESDKATMEVPCPQAGRIVEMKVAVGDKVSEGSLMFLMEVEGDGEAPAAKAEAPAEPEAPVEAPVEAAAEPATPAGGSRTETVTVPDIGGSEDVPVIELSVAEGDTVAVDDPLLVLESDKASMEIPAPFAGKIGKLLVKVGDTVSQGTAILEMTVMDTAAPAQAPASKPASAPSQPAAKQPEPAPAPAPATAAAEPAPTSGKVHAGPAVRKLAREFGVDLAQVKGSGPRNRIVKEDVQRFVKAGMQRLQSGGSAVSGGAGLPTVKLPDFSQFGAIERQPMTKIHQVTAENMQRNWLNVPHVTQFDEADITEMENFRKDQKAAGEKRGVKLTPLAFMLKACAYALKTYPQFNVSLDMDRREVVQKHYIHIGVAVDTPNGLMVPVIRDVDQKSLWEIAEEMADLAAKARDRKLKPAEMQGGCFTISSLGGIGGTAFTPIVNTPEVAILGVSKSQFKPVYDGKGGFVPRLMLPLSLSYDHRAVNGADAARFTALLSDLLGDLRKLLL
ncbi:dihydrolipoyllysine-residue acetyltransferase [Mangrovitalea sediminis]|uniref:dihydrolipoyllysine-residue acetyltransferase n=1 Tax=Mangrovitalea sediminis TaxID=1982043 RepID=UPI000BE4C3C6|nr:dihydrolipoyllysine-residue acetyltransferase [Mangrovitalea sediminis]